MATVSGNLTKINNLQPHTVPLVRLAFDPHIKQMDKPKTQFELIQLKDAPGWHVRITLPHGVEHCISSFKTEAEARTWIGENSAWWLTA